MIRVLVAGFLIVHGLVHVALYVIQPKADAKPPFDSGHSWVLAGMHVAARPARVTSMTLSWLTAALFTVAGLALLVDADVWAPTAVAAAVSALVLKLAYFHPWLLIGLALDAGVLAAVAAEWPASLF
jgi:hypothetical protein